MKPDGSHALHTEKRSATEQLLASLASEVAFTKGVVVTTVPRGDLQIVQPADIGDALLKAYGEGFHKEDRLTWQAIVRRQPVQLPDVWDETSFPSTPYSSYMSMIGATHAVAWPLKAPVLGGYPGAVHLLRSAEEGEFRADEIAKVTEAVRRFDDEIAADRASFASQDASRPLMARPAASFAVVDADLKPQLNAEAWSAVDQGLRGQMVEQTRRQVQHINGHDVTLDRVQLADSHGDQWVYNRVTYKRYPALGDGPFTFFCLQPECTDWSAVKPADFQADPELARLLPAVTFMQDQFARGPTLTEIAQTVRLSPFHFHRRFTELLGMTPKQFMLACQICRAKEELLTGEKELVQIAKECGFAHQSHFTSRFKQATGLTPTRWRRMAQRRGEQLAGSN